MFHAGVLCTVSHPGEQVGRDGHLQENQDCSSYSTCTPRTFSEHFGKKTFEEFIVRILSLRGKMLAEMLIGHGRNTLVKSLA